MNTLEAIIGLIGFLGVIKYGTQLFVTMNATFHSSISFLFLIFTALSFLYWFIDEWCGGGKRLGKKRRPNMVFFVCLLSNLLFYLTNTIGNHQSFFTEGNPAFSWIVGSTLMLIMVWLMNKSDTYETNGWEARYKRIGMVFLVGSCLLFLVYAAM